MNRMTGAVLLAAAAGFLAPMPAWGADDATVATVDGRAITVKRVRDVLGTAAMRHLPAYRGEDETRRLALEKVIEHELVLGYARARELDEKPAIRYPVRNGMATLLVQALDRNLRRGAMGSVPAAEVAKRLPTDWRMIRGRYYIFATAEEAARGRELLLNGEESNADPATHRPAGALVQETGGWLRRGETEFDSAVEEALFALPAGGVSEVFAAPVGYLVAQVEETRVMDEEERETVRIQITRRLEKAVYRARRRELDERLREERGFSVATAELRRRLSGIGDVSALDDIAVGEVDGRTIRFEQVRYLAEKVLEGRPEGLVDYDELSRTVLLNELLAGEARRRGLDEEPLLREAERELTLRAAIDYLRRTLHEGASVTEEDARAYYREHPREFIASDQVEVLYLWTVDPAKAEEAAERLAAGEDFDKVLAKYSDDPAEDAGGAPVQVSRGDFPEPVEDILYEAPVGSVTGIVLHEGYFWIFKVLRRLPQRDLPFEEVAGKLQKRLLKEARESSTRDFVADLRSRATIVIHEDVLANIPLKRDKGEVESWHN